MAAVGPRETCRDCRHFCGEPADLEAMLAGLASLSSAYGSVLGDDGVCEHHGRYVSARACCENFLGHLAGDAAP